MVPEAHELRSDVLAVTPPRSARWAIRGQPVERLAVGPGASSAAAQILTDGNDNMYEALFRQLSQLPPSELPVITAYLDMRPHSTGESPAVRPGLVVLRDRLNEIEKTFLPRGPALDSFLVDRGRIERYVDHEFDPFTHGVAIFACAGQNLFETVEVRTAFESSVTVDTVPDLFQLAKLLDDHETVVVAVVDTNTARIFVTEFGWLEELGGPDDRNPKYYRKRHMGGLSQKRYQRNIEQYRERFAAQVATAIDAIVRRENASRLILAGDEVAIPLLQAALPAETREIVHDSILRIHIRAPRQEVHEEIEPILRQVAEEESCSQVERLMAAVRSTGLGTLGVEHTKAALEHGNIEKLFIDEQADLPREVRAELVRLAGASGADIEIVPGSEALLAAGGVGALLRYRLDLY